MTARALARRLTRFFEYRMAAAGLGFAQFTLLAHLAAATDDTIGALAERVDLDPSTLSRNLRSLERAGLVEIAMVEGDLRRRAVWLTEEGARRLERAVAAWRSARASLTRTLKLDQLRQLATLERRLARDPAFSPGPLPIDSLSASRRQLPTV
jgi:DNA-binding MarR family transcriptional regulator